MAEETSEPQATNTTLYYILGAAIVVAVAAGMYLLRPQQGGQTTSPTPAAGGQVNPVPTKVTGPITKLACEQQYYNPVIGFPKYFISAAGSDLNETSEVTCDFTVSVGGKTVASENAQATLVAAPDRGGQEFHCSTPALELSKNIATKVDVLIKNDKSATATCSKIFQLP